MAEARGFRKGGAKIEVLFLLLVILTFLVAHRLRETEIFWRISSRDMLDLIHTTAAVPDREERLRRIDIVIATHGDDRTPYIDYCVAWMRAARAKEENTDAGKIAAYEAILQRYPSREGIREGRTVALLDWIEAKKAALTGDTETLRNVAERNADASRPDQRNARMFALNALGRAAADADAKREYFDLVLAEYNEGGGDDDMFNEAAEALSGKAMLAKGKEREKLLRDLLKRLRPASGTSEYARNEMLWARFILARDAGPAERLGLFEKIVGEYKDGTTGYVREQLRKVIGQILTLARKRPDRGEILDRLAAELRGSASHPLAARVMMERAEMLSGDAEKAEAYRSVIDAFKDTNDLSAREQVVSAARSMLKFSTDKTATARICQEVASLYEGDANKRLARDIIHMLTDAADAVPGDAEKLATVNRLLEYVKHSPVPLNTRSLHAIFVKKSRLENDPDSTKRFFSEWIADADTEDELFRALWLKLMDSDDRERVNEARGEIIAKFSGTRDAEQALLVVRALDKLNFQSPFSAASDEDIRLYGSLGDRFAGAKDGAGLETHMRALLGKARGVRAATEKTDLCDRILAVPVPPKARLLESIRLDAATLKSKVLHAPKILAQYYAERVAKVSSASEKPNLLLLQAIAEPSRTRKIVLLDQILAGDRGDPKLEMLMMQAFHGRANLAADREEALRLLREAVEYDMGLGNGRKSLSWLFREIYEKLIEMTPDNPEKLALYDEQIQFHLDGGRKLPAVETMMKKAELLGVPEKMELYDRIIELLSDGDAENRRSLLDALLAKAGMIDDDKEKGVLYDRVIEAAGATPDNYNYRRLLSEAIAGKAKLPGGAQFVEEYLDRLLRRLTDIPADAQLAADLIKNIADKGLRDAGYEKILERYTNESSSGMTEALGSVHLSRALASDDLAEYRRLRAERFPDSREEDRRFEEIHAYLNASKKDDDAAREEALSRRLAAAQTEAEKLAALDEFIDRAAGGNDDDEVVRLLFLKAGAVADTDARVRIYEEILDWTIGWRTPSRFKSWFEATWAVEARAKLITDTAERAAYYDSMITQYVDAGKPAGQFLSTLYLNRAALIADHAERKAALERAIGELVRRDMAKHDLEPLYHAVIDLNVEDSLSGENAENTRP